MSAALTLGAGLRPHHDLDVLPQRVEEAGEPPKHTVSSGNVFADMGLPNAEELLAKADLAIQISRIIEERELTQAEAAEPAVRDGPR